ncbi:MAG: HflK protein, partial [Deltaproteobacteria bacterium]|nr:HflK protein [Deltaproteobacteria bacterium]
MSWDWEKLKEQQQGKRGVPPQVDEIVNQLKKFKLPGGLLMVAIILVLFL